MATVPVKEDAFLASQCLDFCQKLAGKSLSFSFSLKIGTNFSFSLDTRGEAALSSAKKKQTPSTLRRNARRREQFLQKKLASPAPVSNAVSEKGTETLQKAPTPHPPAHRRTAQPHQPTGSCQRRKRSVGSRRSVREDVAGSASQRHHGEELREKSKYGEI